MRKLEDFVPADHPLRAIREMVNVALVKMDASFSGMYEADIKGGRPSRAREAPARHALASVLQHPIRAPAHGADPIQPSVSLVHWPGHGRGVVA